MRLPLNGPAPIVDGDALDALLGCHERIRQFSALSLVLASRESVSMELALDAAQRVHRYFALALPLHVADEDVSLAPRLKAVAPASLAATLGTLAEQHEEIELRLVGLLPGWRRLVEAPTGLLASRGLLLEASRGLANLLEEHLRIEESEVFPHVRSLLAPGELDEIHREMRARRAVPG